MLTRHSSSFEWNREVKFSGIFRCLPGRCFRLSRIHWKPTASPLESLDPVLHCSALCAVGCITDVKCYCSLLGAFYGHFSLMTTDIGKIWAQQKLCH